MSARPVTFLQMLRRGVYYAACSCGWRGCETRDLVKAQRDAEDHADTHADVRVAS